MTNKKDNEKSSKIVDLIFFSPKVGKYENHRQSRSASRNREVYKSLRLPLSLFCEIHSTIWIYQKNSRQNEFQANVV